MTAKPVNSNNAIVVMLKINWHVDQLCDTDSFFAAVEAFSHGRSTKNMKASREREAMSFSPQCSSAQRCKCSPVEHLGGVYDL